MSVFLRPLNYATSKISTALIFSAISRASNEKASGDVSQIDLNLEALPSIILSCTALEAFVNEISSLSNAFLFEREQDGEVRNQKIEKQESVFGLSLSKGKAIARMKDNSKSGSFYERYKQLLKALGTKNPPFLQNLSDLENVRHHIVHFKGLDIPIVENPDGVIVPAQKTLEVFNHLKKYSIKGHPIIATEGNNGSVEWTLRISTNAMTIWSIDTIVDAIIYVLDTIPKGSFRDFILKAYSDREKSFAHIFQKRKSEIDSWSNKLFGK